MDAEGLGRKLLLIPPGDPWTPLKSRLLVPWRHLTKCSLCKHFRALSMPALQREDAWPEERLLGDLQQSVPQNGRVHLHILELPSLRISWGDFLPWKLILFSEVISKGPLKIPFKSENSRRPWLSEIPCWKGFAAHSDAAGKWFPDFPAARNAIPAKVWALSGKENSCWKMAAPAGTLLDFLRWDHHSLLEFFWLKQAWK